MTFKSKAAAAPGATFRPVDQSQSLGQASRVPRRSSADSPLSPGVPADFEMPLKAGKELTFTVVASRSFHGSLPAWKA